MKNISEKSHLWPNDTNVVWAHLFIMPEVGRREVALTVCNNFMGLFICYAGRKNGGGGN